MKSIVLLACLLTYCFGQTVITGNLGSASAVAANTATTINYGGGLSLTVTVNVNSNVTLSSYTNVLALPTGYIALSLGFTLSVTNGASVTGSLTTGQLSVAAQALLTAGVNAGCLQFDSVTNTYNEIDVQSYSVNQGITIPIISAGTYLFVGAQANVPVPSFYGTYRALVGGVRKVITFSQGFVVDVTASASTSVVVYYNTTNTAPKNPPNNYIPLNAFFTIELSAATALQATLNYTYTASQISNARVNANTLQIGYYDTTSGSWQFPGSQVNTNTMVVSTTTTHFSTWGVYASSASATVLSIVSLMIAVAVALL
jgi:hypothetical protein